MRQDRLDSVFWSRVLDLAETIDTSGATPADVRDHLRTLEEGYAGVLDPADRFPEYVTVLLCRSVRRCLDEQRA